MKKQLLILIFTALSLVGYSQALYNHSGTGWRQNYVKNDFRDSTFFEKQANFWSNILVNGSIGTTASRVTKIWTLGLESTTRPTFNGTGMMSVADSANGSGAPGLFVSGKYFNTNFALKANLISPVFTTPNIGSATGSITGNAGTVSNATLTTALTVNTGTLTLTAAAANNSVLTIGAGAVSVSGANTGDNATNTQYSGLAASKVSLVDSLLQPNGYTTKKQHNDFVADTVVFDTEEITEVQLVTFGDTTVTEVLGKFVYKTSNGKLYVCIYIGSAHPSWLILN
jgi:hypothetical protein